MSAGHVVRVCVTFTDAMDTDDAEVPRRTMGRLVADSQEGDLCAVDFGAPYGVVRCANWELLDLDAATKNATRRLLWGLLGLIALARDHKRRHHLEGHGCPGCGRRERAFLCRECALEASGP